MQQLSYAMLKPLVIILFALYSPTILGQTNYKGFIGKYPIELVTNIYSDGDARAVYAYQNFDEPIVIDGKLSGDTLTLFEKDKNKTVTATLSFPGFNKKNKTLNGTWTSLQTNKQLSIEIEKEFEIEDGDSIEWQGKEIIQKYSLKNYYFKLVISKAKGDFYPRVTGVKILQKKTDSLIQHVQTDCRLWGLDNIQVGDYNFDGILDFSVFEESYAGPNTSSVYFLYDPTTKKYFDSGFEGVSLEFDQKTKRIFEHNQCCAGRQHTTAKYRVVNNKMVLIEQHCYIWDEKRQDLVERKMKDCQ